jgi:hypothetical protein
MRIIPRIVQISRRDLETGANVPKSLLVLAVPDQGAKKDGGVDDVGKIQFVLHRVPMCSKPSQDHMPLRHLQRTI